jgi:hypothetical protein
MVIRFLRGATAENTSRRAAGAGNPDRVRVESQIEGKALRYRVVFLCGPLCPLYIGGELFAFPRTETRPRQVTFTDPGF